MTNGVTYIKSTVTAGALLRRHVRAAFDVIGMTYTEHKGWTESTFVVRGTDQQWKRLQAWMKEVNGE